MARGVPVQPEQRARAVELMHAGKGRNAIAREVGISTTAVTRIASEENHTFDMAATQDAVAAAKVSHAARRSAIIDRLYARAEALLDRVESPYTYRLMGPDGAQSFTDDHAPSGDEKNIATSLNIYLERAARLEAVDDVEGLAPVESMLGRLAVRFGLTSA